MKRKLWSLVLFSLLTLGAGGALCGCDDEAFLASACAPDGCCCLEAAAAVSGELAPVPASSHSTGGVASGAFRGGAPAPALRRPEVPCSASFLRADSVFSPQTRLRAPPVLI